MKSYVTVTLSLALSLFVLSTSAFAEAQLQTFTIEQSVVIDADIDTVFDYAGEPLNDVDWRSEVNTMEASGPLEIGTTYYEDSHLGLNPHYLTEMIVTDLDYPYLITLDTPEDDLYLQSQRTFEELEDGATLMTYRLEVDVRMPAIATKLLLPQWFVRFHYNNVMRRYLRHLDSILEN